ncbi:peptidoglycan DD-metalloendopeptidase family protein [Candidatus Wolfebacteria bacterium]|nr:peptidoglycan DD-metalloendopeptidase family protein [Candidatus Wolfebacteria bacterium]
MKIQTILFVLVTALVTATVTNAQTLAYISNRSEDTVSVIDTETNTVIKTIVVGDEPIGVAISPDNRSVYVANFHENTLSVIDTTTNTALDTLPAGSAPIGIAVHPSNGRAYITNLLSNRVSVLDLNTGSIITTIAVQPRPVGIAMRPNGNQVYITNEFTDLLTVIDTATNTITTTIPVGPSPYWIAIHPDGNTAYVPSAAGGGLSVVNLTNNTVIQTVPGGGTTGVAVAPLGDRVYATDFSGFVRVVDTQTLQVVDTIPVGAGPLGVDTDPSGNLLYVANQNSNNVSIIDTITSSVTATIPVGQLPQALGEFVVPAFHLNFPVPNLTPTTAELVSVFDHTMTTRYCPETFNGAAIIPFTGEEGVLLDSNEPPVTGGSACGNPPLFSYRKTDGTDFLPELNYTGTTTTGAGTCNYDGHPGWDIRATIGTPIIAATDGNVTLADPVGDPSNGKRVTLDHGAGYETLYLHLDRVCVVEGATVQRGQLIGRSGNTGGVAPHLHFEVRKDSTSVDPYGWNGVGDDPYTTLTGAENFNLWRSDNPFIFTDGFECGDLLTWSNATP